MGTLVPNPRDRYSLFHPFLPRPCLTNFCTHGPNALQADPFQPDSVIASGMATFMVKMIKKYEKVNFRGTQFSMIPYPCLVDLCFPTQLIPNQ